jgi:hypothetical protein
MKMKHLIERCEQGLGEWLSTGQDNANYEAEACKKHSGKNCPPCADGYHMNDSGKCVPKKSVGGFLKRNFQSQKGVNFPDSGGNDLDRMMDKKHGYDRDNRHGDWQHIPYSLRRVKIR